jgi:hypothetical protein
MKKKKLIQVFSNGTLNFSYSICNNFQFINFYNKDNKNFYLNIKNKIKTINNSDFLKYKSKYIIKK